MKEVLQKLTELAVFVIKGILVVMSYVTQYGLKIVKLVAQYYKERQDRGK